MTRNSLFCCAIILLTGCGSAVEGSEAQSGNLAEGVSIRYKIELPGARQAPTLAEVEQVPGSSFKCEYYESDDPQYGTGLLISYDEANRMEADGSYRAASMFAGPDGHRDQFRVEIPRYDGDGKYESRNAQVTMDSLGDKFFMANARGVHNCKIDLNEQGDGPVASRTIEARFECQLRGRLDYHGGEDAFYTSPPFPAIDGLGNEQDVKVTGEFVCNGLSLRD